MEEDFIDCWGGIGHRNECCSAYSRRKGRNANWPRCRSARNGKPGDRRYPSAPDRTQARSQNGGARLLRPATRIPADQRSGLDRLSRVLRSRLRHAQPARGRRHPQRCQQWRRGRLACAGFASSQHRRCSQVLEQRIPGDQGSLSRRVRADGQHTRSRRAVGRSSRR